MAWLLRVLKSTAVCAGLSLVLCASAASFTVIEGEYKLPASFDAEVTTDLETELWARVYRPDTGGPYPLVVFLHGNHATCGYFDAALGIRIDDNSDYTTTGTCPAGYVVVPSHAGYEYLATSLSAKGYVVVSINADRGINAAPGVSGDNGLNLRRGRMVLRHLEELAKWNTGSAATPASLGFSLLNMLDYSHVGLMGHSRGGEGMRAAVAQYKDPGSPWPARTGPITFQGLFEIGPVDGQTSRILNAEDMTWNVLLPGCDGDVSDLEGLKPFDRMLLITTEATSWRKSTFEVYGANHDFYNTQWQQSDAASCMGQTPLFPQTLGSPKQRKTASQTVIPFMWANIGATLHPSQARRFDPSFPLPASLTSITEYARGFTPTPRSSQNFIIDNFDKATGTSSENVANQSSGLSTYSHGSGSPSDDVTQRAATVSWTSPGPSTFLQINASNIGVPLDVSSFPTLQFRVALQCSGTLCSSSPSPGGDVDFSIALVNSDNSLSTPITLKSVASVRRPVGSISDNVVFQTVRVSLMAFLGANLTQFRGVRFTFDQTSNRSLILGNVGLTKQKAGPGGLAAGATSAESAGETHGAARARPTPPTSTASSAFGIWTSSKQIEEGGQVVEIEVASSRPFRVGGALPELRIGSGRFTLSRYADGGTERLVFTLTADEYDAALNGAKMTVVNGGAPTWSFGKLTK